MTTMHIMNILRLVEDADSQFRKREIEWLMAERNKRLGVIEQNDGPITSRLTILDIRKNNIGDIL